jgi:hypothetical protein
MYNISDPSLPLCSTILIPSFFMTLFNMQRLAHKSTRLKQPPEKTTWPFGLPKTCKGLTFI